MSVTGITDRLCPGSMPAVTRVGSSRNAKRACSSTFVMPGSRRVTAVTYGNGWVEV